ncbi:MAG TPA: MBL fold metallo-hydrolase [Bacillota bacterium]|nr:MBL fold metallo-hydrolase [Bacillota bacterium]
MTHKRFFIILPLLLFLFFLLPPIVHSAQGGILQVHFIDVGQGDSILIQTPEDKVILVDGGPPKSGKKVIDYLKNEQIKNIDLVIATHPDIDHIGGLPKIMNSTIGISKIMETGKFHTTRTYLRYIYHVKKHMIPVTVARVNQTIDLDEQMNIDVLNADEGKKNNNQSSIVLKIRYKDIDFLLMGDVGIEQEKKLPAKKLQTDFLKVAHHGSNTSTSHDFLRNVKPKVAVLTYGDNNKFGHPVDRVINTLDMSGAAIYSTAAYGDIVISTDGKSYIIDTEKDPLMNMLND